MAETKAPPKKKRQTSFGQFDQGRGSRAARTQHVVSRDARTITGKRLTKKQRDNIARQNRRKS
jgi:hypothetical protein